MQNKLLICNHCSQRIRGYGSLLLTAVLLLNGCGTETYEQRLNETTQFFAYQDVRNQALSNTWSSPSVSMRVPIEFKQISAPPAAPAAASDNSEATIPEPDSTIDPRQPDYVDLILPGLEGAWRVEVPVDLENEIVDRPAYLYVLSNNSLLKEKNMDEALIFFEDVNNQIASTFNQFINNEEFKTERFPQGKGYIEPKSFNVGLLEPEMPIDGVPYEFQIYQVERGDNQVVILLVIPKNMTGRSNIKEHLDFSLETVDIVSPKSGSGRSNSAAESTKF
ncbi:hypothetical protein [uncultured Gimesia sp.]|uniref:hypothetical protein n=1 Tax=uncultured Gimesia sp. TaxID=1678688 RepID=UPI0030D8ECBD|tara:strand:+ start:105958 stop:106791 length:834 start_codon:yes stop_codon:yes gene_type:complete